MRRCVFLDRDGVINKAIVRNGRPFPPSNVGELALEEGAVEATTLLKHSGFALVVATNQPDVARGLIDRAAVETINHHIALQLTLDAFYVCYHDDEDRCECRKPLPGMLLSAASDLGLDLKSSYMVGDRWKDVIAGQAAGCKTILVDKGYDEPSSAVPADHRCSTLLDAAHWIVANVEQHLNSVEGRQS